MAFDVAAERRALSSEMRTEIDFAAHHGGKGDLYLVPAVFIGAAGIGIGFGDLALGALAGVAPAGGLVAWLWFKYGYRARRAKKAVIGAWLAHFESFGAHAVSGEKVEVTASDLSGSFLSIRFSDGCWASVHSSEIQDKDGLPYSPEPKGSYIQTRIATTRRMSKARWQTDDGRIGFVRGYELGSASEYNSTPDRLLLKFDDGYDWVSLRDLTPVA